jgi:hypothetical protein
MVSTLIDERSWWLYRAQGLVRLPERLNPNPPAQVISSGWLGASASWWLRS